jgi:hypothetical protein
MLGATLLNDSTIDHNELSFTYRDTIVASQKVNWRIEDIIGGDKKLDFSKRFMPESLARVNDLSFLDDDERRILNQIRGNTYLAIFGLVEEFILPFVLDHVQPFLDGDDYRVRAFLQFASEEAKHIQLFKTFSLEFRENFGSECKVIGPAVDIAKAILAHEPLGVALAILHIEWMSQRHYIESVKDDETLDPQFRSLLKNHWLEEAQHAKLDGQMVLALARPLGPKEIERAVDEYLEIGGFLDTGVQQQVLLDLESFEVATGRKLNEKERDEFINVQNQANRWTYLGSGMTHPKFLETLNTLSPEQRERIETISPMFC